MKTIKIMLLSLIITSSSYALQGEHLVWEKVPLTIELPNKQERLIQFPQTIKIIDQQLSPNLEILKVKGSLYLKAQAPFKQARIIVQLIPDGEVIILNLKADDQFNNTTPIEILTDDPKRESKDAASHYEYNAIQLTRFAIQSLYAPERVRQIPNGVYRTPMQTHKTTNLFYGASIEAHPIASWRGGSLYVTAVELKNLLDRPMTLKPSGLIGHWQTASFYPSARLSPRSQHESTVVFLVSTQSFHEALTMHTRFSR
ncbi:TIGR03749 family integrating conjugative element protein [Legionella nagasakiensis]|uniref:TIGR03749 family integrating conjugative element protein n=1 Tax=Legionella nagasakiensis TaxID=535290 RepID=UPI001055C2F9|nr:TIGR03749 family integrating conjugative element protein [Legionella nagasakiensis]